MSPFEVQFLHILPIYKLYAQPFTQGWVLNPSLKAGWPYFSTSLGILTLHTSSIWNWNSKAPKTVIQSLVSLSGNFLVFLFGCKSEIKNMLYIDIRKTILKINGDWLLTAVFNIYINKGQEENYVWLKTLSVLYSVAFSGRWQRKWRENKQAS